VFLGGAAVGFSGGLDFPVGLHRSDLFWLEKGDPVAADALIQEMAAVGPAFIRINVRERKQFEAVCAHIRSIQAYGIQVLLELAADTDPAVYPSGLECRPGHETLWPSFPVSKMDVAAYEQWLEELLDVLQKREALPEILQVGNELNWAGFNGDYPILPAGEGRVFDETDWEKLPDAVRQGARKAGQIADLTARKVRERFLDSAWHPKVILGSLTKPENRRWLARIGGTFLPPESFLAIVAGTFAGMPSEERTDYLASLDGISLHFYPQVPSERLGDSLPSLFRDYLRDYMEPVRKVTDLTVYVTEFGLVRSRFQSEGDRAEAFATFLSQMDRVAQRHRWGGVAVFSWDQLDHSLVDPALGTLDPKIPAALGWKKLAE
jgi:hypothetical protein